MSGDSPRSLQFGHGSSPWKCTVGEGNSVGRGMMLQFGHGSSPWKCATSSLTTSLPRKGFNSATAHHRGNAGDGRPDADPAVELQFGHGSSPWKCVEWRACNEFLRRLQFGHGSSPWKCLGRGGVGDRRQPASIRPRLITVEMLGGGARPGHGRAASIRPRLITVEMPAGVIAGALSCQPLQFGHGSSPWKCVEGAGVLVRAGGRFNSATAHHRGNAPSGPSGSGPCSKLQFGHGSSPWKCGRPRCGRVQQGRASIRPRLITVEMRSHATMAGFWS